ncbi:Pvc16 family protein [Lentzea sp. E54]|uniref:Pvc16 family protein n=1 Tax=Lentzea xerophila TaxID=3435883 RepID=UPI003DA36276
MIHDVDATLAGLMVTALPEGTAVTFDAPQSSWEVDAPGSPLVSAALLDVCEDADGVSAQPWVERRDRDGTVVARQADRPQFAFTYLLSVWGVDRAEEHRTLGTLLVAFPEHVPGEALVGSVRERGVRIRFAAGAGSRYSWVWASWGVRVRGCVLLDVLARPPLADEPELARAPESVVLSVSGRDGDAAPLESLDATSPAGVWRRRVRRIQAGAGTDETPQP